MKTPLFSFLLLGAAAELSAAAPMHRLQVELMPRFNGAPLVFDAVLNTTAPGQRVSVTRLDFLLSNIAFRHADGAWLGLTNWFAYVSMREECTSFELNNLPAGRYDRLRFHVGVPTKINHRNPADLPAGHPLNPNVNGLHWSWQGGYVFLAVEGNWGTPALRDARAANDEAAPAHSESSSDSKPRRIADPRSEVEVSGYSFHIATDRQLMTVELPIALDLTSDRQLRIALNVDAIFARPNLITLSEGSVSTHSRDGDALADQLRENIERAFALLPVATNKRSADFQSADSGGRPLRRVHRQTGSLRYEDETLRVLIASNATPYRFSFSQFFPQPALPLDNPLTEEGVYLGALLFFDPRLSINSSQSCASCHKPTTAFIDPHKPVSLGAEGHPGTRNTMPLFNLAWKSAFFWDGRAPSLREQVLQPITNPFEMHETLENVVARVKSSRVNARHRARAMGQPHAEPFEEKPLFERNRPTQREPLSAEAEPPTAHDYPSLFARAFGTPEITADRMARALEQFLLAQVSHDSKFDRVLRGETKLNDEEQRGFELFHTEYDPRRGHFGADCFHCHGGPLFQSQSFANNGLDSDFADLGRYLVTKKDGDKGKFAVPSLRNAAVTAPYMHDGRFATLEQVIQHYSTSVKRSATLDPNIAKHPGGGVPLTDADQKALLAFLKTLTDERFHLRSKKSSGDKLEP